MTLGVILLSLVIGSASMDVCIGCLGRWGSKTRKKKKVVLLKHVQKEKQLLWFSPKNC